MSEPATSSHWRALLDLIRPDARRFGLLAAALAAAGTLPVLGPLLVRQVIDRAAEGIETGVAPANRDIVIPAAAFLAIAIASQVARVFVAWFATNTAWTTANRLRVELTEHVLGLDHAFHRRHAPGELVQRIDGDITAVSDFLGRVLLKTGGTLLILGGMVFVVLVIDWRLGLGFIVYMLIAGRLAVIVRDRSIEETVAHMGAEARLFGGIEERLVAAEDLRANGAGEHAMRRFVTEATGALGAIKRMERAFLGLWWTLQGSLATGLVIALVVSAFFIERDIISIGTAFLFLQYSIALRKPLEEIVDQFDIVQKANGAMVRVAEMKRIESAIVEPAPDAAESPRPSVGPLAVEFDGITFDYGDDQPVIRSLSLAVAPGTSVGVVGRTGSGKTTLSRLLLRLVDPTDGAVRLGGVDLRAVSGHERRRRVALVPQEVNLFGGTVRDNLTFFDRSIDDERARLVLAEVGLHELDLDHDVGSGGAGLSAGQAQLLALARVWLRDPDVVVLDEATSRVDPDTEHRLQDAIARLLEGRTALVIAHRLSTLRSVDRIVVVDDGEILEEGDRALLEADEGSEFRRLLELALEATP